MSSIIGMINDQITEARRRPGVRTERKDRADRTEFDEFAANYIRPDVKNKTRMVYGVGSFFILAK